MGGLHPGVWGGADPANQILWDTAKEQAVRILLNAFLFVKVFKVQLQLYLCLILYFGIVSVLVPVQFLAPLKFCLIKSLYRSGTVNSNTVNLKFHLIRSFFEIFVRFLSFDV